MIRATAVWSGEDDDEVYHLQRVRGADTTFEVYALAGRDVDSIMRRLIDGASSRP